MHWRCKANFNLMMLTAALFISGVDCVTAGMVKVPNGFMTGDMYRNLSEPEKQFYAMGLVDGIFIAPAFGAPVGGKVYQINDCIAKMKSDQIAAVFSKKLLDHPEVWHKPMHLTGVSALIEACHLEQ